eukprot:CAMPEP_0114582092 /NCGR_PEP_ID=MMETSP0125-20121206/6123_1 /TAXON_ID=485358 ORGANISM="Aristerostoma sp., Strain ATCC 50986" /NCGR_SAMPLE_ID=MMETSP0125 /ASSEMBLY_ACC=CAM_ASM_000245 /LENGTH=91 /DNA_ID=CAMNT_0001774799 /DNA_START=1842 /DNA_END=2117 /DNA_ORIENTATION=-
MVTKDEFKQKWKIKSSQIWRTSEFELDSAIVKSAYDFKKYFNYLVDLKPTDEYDFVQGSKKIKLGGAFELNIPNIEYLLRITVFPNQRAVI